MIGYIYKWENKQNGKVYIGQTMNRYGYKERWSQHRYSALNGEHNNHFHNAIRKYGYDGFEKSVIETIEMDNRIELKNVLDKLEIRYIEKYDSFNSGYNSTLGGDFNVWNSGNEERVNILKENARKRYQEHGFKWKWGKYERSIVLIDKNYNLLHRFDSVKKASDFSGIHSNTIVGICRCGRRDNTKGFSKLSGRTINGKMFRYQDDWIDGLSEDEIRNKYFNINYSKPEFITLNNDDIACNINGELIENIGSKEFGIRKIVRNNPELLTNMQQEVISGNRVISTKNFSMFRKRLLKRLESKIS